MTIVLCVLEGDHPYQIGDTLIPIKRLQLREGGDPTDAMWVNKVAMLMERDEDGNVTPIKVGSGQRVMPGEELVVSDVLDSN